MNGAAARASDVWFVTGAQVPLAHDETENDGDDSTWLTHAKTVGTIFTACGVDASFWHTRWGLNFPVTAPVTDLVSCQDCTEVLQALANAVLEERRAAAIRRSRARGRLRRASF